MAITRLLENPGIPKSRILYYKLRKGHRINNHPVLVGKAKHLLEFLNSNPGLRKHYYQVHTAKVGLYVRIGKWVHQQTYLPFSDPEAEYAMYKREGADGKRTMIERFDLFEMEK